MVKKAMYAAIGIMFLGVGSGCASVRLPLYAASRPKIYSTSFYRGSDSQTAIGSLAGTPGQERLYGASDLGGLVFKKYFKKPLRIVWNEGMMHREAMCPDLYPFAKNARSISFIYEKSGHWEILFHSDLHHRSEPLHSVSVTNYVERPLIVGVWERSSYKVPDAQPMPGTPPINERLVFSETGLFAILQPSESSVDIAGLQGNYDLRRDRLYITNDGKKDEYRIFFRSTDFLEIVDRLGYASGYQRLSLSSDNVPRVDQEKISCYRPSEAGTGAKHVNPEFWEEGRE